LKGYLTGVVSALSLVSTTKTASSFAGWVLLALRLIEWLAFGGSALACPIDARLAVIHLRLDRARG